MIKRIIACFSVLLLPLICFSSVNVKAENITAEIVIEATTGRVLYEKNSSEKLPIASLTKILTAITVIENCALQTEVSIPEKCCGIEGSSVYLQPNEILTVSDLLYGLMLRSGNDCAEALACTVGKDIHSFATLMNKTAEKIGAVNSNFVNPHGLNDEDHYSTAYDIAIITAYGLKNKEFSKIVSTKKKIIPNTVTGENRVLINKNKLLYNYGYCTGVKTGYTKKAGRCLASSAKKDGVELVSVVLNCGPMYEVSEYNFEKAFSEYKMINVCDPDRFKLTVNLPEAKNECEGYIKQPFSYPMTEKEKDKLKTEIKIDQNITLPLKKDEKIGVLQIFIENQLIFSQNIYTILDVEKKFDYTRPLDDWNLLGTDYEN